MIGEVAFSVEGTQSEHLQLGLLNLTPTFHVNHSCRLRLALEPCPRLNRMPWRYLYSITGKRLRRNTLLFQRAE